MGSVGKAAGQQRGIPFWISPCRSGAFYFLMLCFIAVFPGAPAVPAPRAAVGRAVTAQAGFLTFPSGQRSLCALGSRGDTASGALSPPASHHTHPPGERRSGGKWGRALPGFRVQPGVWDKNPPPKKSRQKNPFSSCLGLCFSEAPGWDRDRQVLQCGVPWGLWGALMGWEQVGSILPKLEPRSSSCCGPPQLHIYFIYVFSSITKVNLISSLPQGFSPPA